ncbi:MAG: helix-turn-helix transcriptional regulator [Lachnospiraceae bacterium]|nr:helix-turn-helix transcriptional regulator [Lachnospiraceae bacterium]
MYKNNSIQDFVGENIKKFRKAEGLSLEELAGRVYKSKSTISKYEKGTISIDIATLDEIAKALEVDVSMLLSMPDAPKNVSAMGRQLDDRYFYAYDGRSKRIIKSVIETYATEDPKTYAVRFFYDVPRYDKKDECSSLFKGECAKYEMLENFSLENMRHPIEQLWMCLAGGLSHNQLQLGLFAGLYNTTLLPAVRKVAVSPAPIPESELMKYLLLTKEDFQKIKKMNLFIIDEFIS